MKGLEITEAIWKDMTEFNGYLDHAIVRGLDDLGHIMVVGRWTSWARADAVLARPAERRNAQRANLLVNEPRHRMVGEVVSGSP